MMAHRVRPPRLPQGRPPGDHSAVSGREISPEAVRLAGTSPFLMPRGLLIALVNARTRKSAREQGLDLEAQVYAENGSALRRS